MAPLKQDLSFSIFMFADFAEDLGDLSISLTKSSGNTVVCGEDIPSAELITIGFGGWSAAHVHFVI